MRLIIEEMLPLEWRELERSLQVKKIDSFVNFEFAPNFPKRRIMTNNLGRDVRIISEFGITIVIKNPTPHILSIKNRRGKYKKVRTHDIISYKIDKFVVLIIINVIEKILNFGRVPKDIFKGKDGRRAFKIIRLGDPKFFPNTTFFPSSILM